MSRGIKNRGTYWLGATRSLGSSPAGGRMDIGPSPFPIGLRTRRKAESLKHRSRDASVPE